MLANEAAPLALFRSATLTAGGARAQQPTPPGQPRTGPGGSAYVHASLTASRFGSGADEVFVVRTSRADTGARARRRVLSWVGRDRSGPLRCLDHGTSCGAAIRSSIRAIGNDLRTPPGPTSHGMRLNGTKQALEQLREPGRVLPGRARPGVRRPFDGRPRRRESRRPRGARRAAAAAGACRWTPGKTLARGIADCLPASGPVGAAAESAAPGRVQPMTTISCATSTRARSKSRRGERGGGEQELSCACSRTTTARRR